MTGTDGCWNGIDESDRRGRRLAGFSRRTRRWRPGVVALGVVVLGVLSRLLLSVLVTDARPNQELWLVPVGGFSFPSGHAAVAFFMMAPAFVISANRRGARGAWIAVGICYGLAMGFTRVMQGGHFVSDVLWAGIIVYLVGVGLDRLLLRPREKGYDRGTAGVLVQDSISVAPTS